MFVPRSTNLRFESNLTSLLTLNFNDDSFHLQRTRETAIINSILVAYASRTGTTAGVAEAIGRTLAESGARLTCAPWQSKGPHPYRRS